MALELSIWPWLQLTYANCSEQRLVLRRDITCPMQMMITGIAALVL